MSKQTDYGTLPEGYEEIQNISPESWIKKYSKHLIGVAIIISLACIGVNSFSKDEQQSNGGQLKQSASAVNFSNAYIQNVHSGDCITVDKDVLLNPLLGSTCNCGSYQFWNMLDGEHVRNELAMHSYMDDLFGNAANGATVGIYDLTGANWQKWKANEDNNGNYAFVDVQTNKCLHQNAQGLIDILDCNDNDASQKWKIVENPCGKLPELPKGRFQLRNPETGMCATVLDNSNDDWAKIVTGKCSADNDHQYWKLNNRNIVSEGLTKLCMANWDALGHPGVTQCVCVDDAIHDYRLAALGGDSFNLVTAVDGKCVVVSGDTENTPLKFEPCDRSKKEEQWVFYDSPHPPQPKQVNFSNAYIQNVQSGDCITVDKDVLLNPLLGSTCNCGSYQFWNMLDGEHVRNELAMHSYMDDLFGNAVNGATVGIYDLTGSNWQKWKANEDNRKRSECYFCFRQICPYKYHDYLRNYSTFHNLFEDMSFLSSGADQNGNCAFVDVQTNKCLHQNAQGLIDILDCKDNDASQKWKIVENPCGKLPELPKGRFQLRNPKTGMCASVLDNSNDDWAKIVTGKCTADNDHQYWKLNNRNIVSEGLTKLCMANWDALGHPGVTQCVCVDDAIHDYRLAALGGDSFDLVTAVDGKCVAVSGDSENSPLKFEPCDRSNNEQQWVFYDSSHPHIPPPPPPPPNVIPKHLARFFSDGSMNWLTLTRYHYLVGGHWDANNEIWYTADNKAVKPGTTIWTEYFGNAQPSFLDELFQSGKSWSDQFRWMTPDFFDTWKGSHTQTDLKTLIPDNVEAYFTSGVMNWLTPARYNLLKGGSWDSELQIWKNADGTYVLPSTPEWTIYFGDLRPSDLTSVLEASGSNGWENAFGWITPSFFHQWNGWPQQNDNVHYIRRKPFAYTWDFSSEEK